MKYESTKALFGPVTVTGLATGIFLGILWLYERLDHSDSLFTTSDICYEIKTVLSDAYHLDSELIPVSCVLLFSISISCFLARLIMGRNFRSSILTLLFQILFCLATISAGVFADYDLNPPPIMDGPIEDSGFFGDSFPFIYSLLVIAAYFVLFFQKYISCRIRKRIAAIMIFVIVLYVISAFCYPENAITNRYDIECELPAASFFDTLLSQQDGNINSSVPPFS